MLLSTFSNYTDRSPQAETLERIVEVIRSDNALAEITRAFRATGDQNIKVRSACFAPACIFKDGKAKKNITALTGLCMADFDHLEVDRLEELRQKVNSDPHTLMSYVTISGKGLRVVFRYDMPADLPLDSLTRFYEKRVFPYTNAYYSEFLGIAADKQCKNVSRLSGMCHDEGVYYRADAEAFSKAWLDECSAEQTRLTERYNREQRGLRRVESVFNSVVAQELADEGAVYASGSHNDYVMRLGYKMNAFGVPLDDVLLWTASRFSDYDGTEQVIRSCYQRTEEYGSRRWQKSRAAPKTRDADGQQYATVEEIKTFLSERVSLRLNMVTNRVEYSMSH